MSIDSVSASSAYNIMPGAIQALKASGQAQSDMAEKLLSVNLQNMMADDKMSIAQQIIDVYA